MSYAQLTPEQPPSELEQETTEDTSSDQAAPDELKHAQARRLELLEQERAGDEGMPPAGRAMPSRPREEDDPDA